MVQKQGAGAWQSAVRPLTSGSGDIKTEIAELSKVLNQVEERVRTIGISLLICIGLVLFVLIIDYRLHIKEGIVEILGIAWV